MEAVSEAELLALAFKACPSFAAVWSSQLEMLQPEDAIAPQGIYNVLSDLAHHVFELWQKGEGGALAAVSKLAEDLMSNGDAELSQAVPIGFLEDLWGHPDTPDEFRAFVASQLGPLARKAWDSIVRHNGYYSGD